MEKIKIISKYYFHRFTRQIFRDKLCRVKSLPPWKKKHLYTYLLYPPNIRDRFVLANRTAARLAAEVTYQPRDAAVLLLLFGERSENKVAR